jgi:hypothetical protein
VQQQYLLRVYELIVRISSQRGESLPQGLRLHIRTPYILENVRLATLCTEPEAHGCDESSKAEQTWQFGCKKVHKAITVSPSTTMTVENGMGLAY